MPRKRIPAAPVLDSWEDANNALLEIAQAEVALTKIEGDMNVKINLIKETAETAATPIKERIAELERQLKAFAELNRPDFGKVKTKKLTFGEVGFRASSSIKFKTAQTQKIIENLRKLDMADCINVKETINKDVLRTYTDEKVIQSGATVQKTNVFWYETDKQKLADSQG